MTRDTLSAVLSTMGRNRGYTYPSELVEKAMIGGEQDKQLALLIEAAMKYERWQAP